MAGEKKEGNEDKGLDVKMPDSEIAYELAKKQREISIAEFFEKNRHLLGFDNKRKALLTAVKEGVDNSLDACEEARILPEVSVEVMEMSEDRFRVIVEDNGPGIVKAQIPKVFGKLLYGSKFHHLQQKRGQQGIGISAAVLYGQLTTGKPAKIISRIGKKDPANYYELNIDIQGNKPEVVKESTTDWEKERGTKVELELEASYQKGLQSVDEYLKETAIINPHVTIIYTSPKAEHVVYSRSTEELPAEPKEIKPHPYGVEVGLLIRMLDNTESRTLQSFLTAEFSRVGDGTAKEICQNSGLLPNMKPRDVQRHQAEKLMQGIEKTKIIAPPTDCLSPIGEALIEKGLRSVINAEFYCSTSRPPSVYRGNPFVIECCTGDTEIMLENGRISTIKEYVENLNTEKILSMNSELKIVPTNVLAWHKFENKHKLLKITTSTGKTLKVTANNELPILEDGKVIWVKAEELMTGDCIATPRKIDLHPQIPEIIDLLEPEYVKVMNDVLVKNVLSILKTKYSSLKIVAKTLGVKYEHLKSFNRNKNIGRPTLKLFYEMVKAANLDPDLAKKKINRIAYVDNRYNNPIPVTLPSISEDLMYTLGLLDSDGYISKASIIFVNKDETLHEAFKRNIKFLFGLEVKKYTLFNSNISNKTLYKILMKIKAIMPQMSNHLIISWLKGIVDGDGGINVNDGKIKSINIAAAEHKQAKLVQTLLLRIGIISKIEFRKPSESFGFINGRAVKTKKIKHDIVIQTNDGFKKFSDLISFRQLSRANKIRSVLNNLSINARGDLLSLGSAIKSLRAENKIFQYELGFDELTVREVEKGRRDMTRQHLQQIVVNKQLSGRAFTELKLLAFSDIFWDKVVNIEEHPFEQYVYDLTTKAGNFLADNIIMHNCGIAYGGEIPSDSPVTLLRFANRVPLLYQQGACSMTESIAKTSWKPYGLGQSSSSIPQGPAVILIHMASVWVPFTSEAKEALAHYPEIIKEMKLAMQECGRKLGLYINKKTRATRQLERSNIFELYIPEVADALAALSGKNKELILQGLKKMIEKPEIKAHLANETVFDEKLKLNLKREENEEIEE